MSREVVEILNRGGEFEDVKDLVAARAGSRCSRTATWTRASVRRHGDGPDQ